MQKWEYLTVNVISGSTNLVHIGEQGWEMCGVKDGGMTLYFKRPAAGPSVLESLAALFRRLHAVPA